MDTAHFHLIKDILDSIHFASIATVSEGHKPWNTPVVVVHDNDLNMYWFSDKQSVHARNVRATSGVFIVIFDSTVPVHGGLVDRAFYTEADAAEVSDSSEIALACSLLGTVSPKDYAGDAVKRVYKAVPKHVWINDVQKRGGKIIRDMRVELDLPKLKRFLSS